mmetsp:Transcript_35971/g.106318  ORF Transcript_35971/g.106318 Transcript_35971/m.106318 type:complete len:224 (+) Transcript_35971:1181-1852(+)
MPRRQRRLQTRRQGAQRWQRRRQRHARRRRKLSCPQRLTSSASCSSCARMSQPLTTPWSCPRRCCRRCTRTLRARGSLCARPTDVCETSRSSWSRWWTCTRGARGASRRRTRRRRRCSQRSSTSRSSWTFTSRSPAAAATAATATRLSASAYELPRRVATQRSSGRRPLRLVRRPPRPVWTHGSLQSRRIQGSWRRVWTRRCRATPTARCRWCSSRCWRSRLR